MASFLTAFGNWRSVIGLLMTQEIDYRFRGTRFATLIALTEPFLVVAITIAMRTLFRGKFPAYGTSDALFYSTGILGFYVFLRLSIRARVARYGTGERLPNVSATDFIIAAVIVEAAVTLAMTTVWFIGLWLYGVEQAWPNDIVECIVALSLLITLGVGVGLTSSAVARRFVYWRMIANRLTGRTLLFVSGVFFVVDFLPVFVRNIIVWNPVVHGITWFRLGMYGQYPAYTLDRDYLIGWALGSLFLGVVLHRVTLRSES